jgi:hypothetical protein
MQDNYEKWQTREGIKNLPEFGGRSGSSESTGGSSGGSSGGTLDYTDDDAEN